MRILELDEPEGFFFQRSFAASLSLFAFLVIAIVFLLFFFDLLSFL